MKRWKIGAIVCAIAVCLSMALTGCASQNYTPEGKSQTISSSALGKAGTLRVGVNASSAPLAGQTSSSSRIVGIDVDVAAYIADQLGTKVEVVDVGSDPVSALDDGKVDIALGIDASDTDSDYWCSDPYLSTGVALFAADGSSKVPALDSKPKIAAQGSSRSAWRVTNLFGDESLVSQTDLKSAFEALKKGSVEYVAADAIIGTYVAHSNDYEDQIVALMQEPSGYCIAVAKKNTELQEAISSAVSSLVKGGVIDVIEDKWLGQAIDLDGVKVLKSAANDSKSSASASSEESEDGDDAESEGDADELSDDGTAAGDAADPAAADATPVLSN